MGMVLKLLSAVLYRSHRRWWSIMLLVKGREKRPQRQASPFIPCHQALATGPHCKPCLLCMSYLESCKLALSSHSQQRDVMGSSSVWSHTIVSKSCSCDLSLMDVHELHLHHAGAYTRPEHSHTRV